MNARAAEVATWTARQWCLGILLALLAQVAYLAWMAGDSAEGAARPLTQTRWRVAGFKVQTDPVAELPHKDDPTLFALVSPQGFSRSAWLSIPPFQYQMTNPPEPRRWLTLPADELTGDFAEFVQTNLLNEEVISRAPAPAIAKLGLPTPVVTAATRVRIESGLADRALAPGLALPRQPQVILTNSVVRVLVDPDGLTLSAALLSSSGVAQADQDALQAARRARFVPTGRGGPSPAGVSFGTLVFEWAGVQWAEPTAAAALATHP